MLSSQVVWWDPWHQTGTGTGRGPETDTARNRNAFARGRAARRIVVDERDTERWAPGTAAGSRADPTPASRTEVYGPTAAAATAEYRRLFLLATEAV